MEKVEMTAAHKHVQGGQNVARTFGKKEQYLDEKLEYNYFKDKVEYLSILTLLC